MRSLVLRLEGNLTGETDELGEQRDSGRTGIP